VNNLDIKDSIRSIPDFPKPGILFRDITTLLNDPAAFSHVINRLTERLKKKEIDVIVAIEARGFIIGAPLAYNLKASFVPVRKKGKLPSSTVSAKYDLEYGSEVVEMHKDAIQPGQKIVIIDDLLATGGTARAVSELVEKLRGRIVELDFIIELEPLKGREKLNYDVYSMISYSES
jgi:adenine phosphoribosyltransferase